MSILDLLALTGGSIKFNTNRAPLIELNIERSGGRVKVRVTRPIESGDGHKALRTRDATHYMDWDQVEPVVIALLEEAGHKPPSLAGVDAPGGEAIRGAFE